MSAKKMINQVEGAVDDCIEGLLASNPDLALLEGHRAVVRADLEHTAKGRVCLISGGGSGHEPAFLGYVGQGMLDAAVAGDIFTSPPSNSVLATILTVAECGPAAILILVINYTGDRLNFGMALERAKAFVSVQVNMVVVGDDCAVPKVHHATGRRGLAGAVLAIKVAGAMAEQGKCLEDISARLTSDILPNLGTIGTSLAPCLVPGRDEASFHLDAEEMVLGLGIHGEAGVKRMKTLSCHDTIEIMLDQMTCARSKTSLALPSSKYESTPTPVVVMINNLGGLSLLEMGIVLRDTKKRLEQHKNCKVHRLYSGHFMTSLDTTGFSVTVLRLTGTRCKQILAELDRPAWALGWSGMAATRDVTRCGSKISARTPPEDEQMSKCGHVAPACSSFFLQALSQSVRFACEALMSCEAQLNMMDSGSGDGDCGSTLKRGAVHVLTALKSPCFVMDCCPVALFRMIGSVAGSVMGGSSGALYAIFFHRAASVLSDHATISSVAVCKALAQGVQAVSKYGGARPGDRTLLDALNPASRALDRALQDQPDAFLRALETATIEAESGAQHTVSLKAAAGRASSVPHAELKHPDPGAHAVGIIMRAIFEAVKLKSASKGRPQ